MIQNSNERKPTRLLQITLSARPVCGGSQAGRSTQAATTAGHQRADNCQAADQCLTRIADTGRQTTSTSGQIQPHPPRQPWRRIAFLCAGHDSPEQASEPRPAPTKTILAPPPDNTHLKQQTEARHSTTRVNVPVDEATRCRAASWQRDQSEVARRHLPESFSGCSVCLIETITPAGH